MRSLLFVFLSIFTFTKAQYILGRRQTDASLTPGPVSVVSSSTATSSTATPSSTATLSIHNPTQLTTCQSYNITWDYTGPSPAQLMLELTDIDVDQSTTSPPPPTILKILSSSIDATLGSWTWQRVDVSSGYYILGAVLEATTQTEPFFIANGSDTSCIQTLPSPTHFDESSKSHVGAIVIVGGVVGGVVVMIAVVVVTLLLWRRSRRSHDRHPAAAGRWGGLGSTDDNDPFSGAKMATQARRRTESNNDEIYSIDDEKIISATTDPDPLPYTTHHRRTSTQSSFRNSTRQQPPTSYSNQPDSIALPVIDTTTTTYSESRRRGSVDVGDIGRSISAPGTTRDSQQLTESPHRADFSSPEKMTRSTSSSSAARRSSRKPVPHYDAADIETNSNTVMPPHEPGFTNADSPVNTSKDHKHKSRLGDGRPVHYLIPDLPPAGNVS